ncbi:CRE-TTR-8 protein [Aphelenchoides avenae]|nr:CRE-TTR-8 protein [Aphelenchus avenae]
MSHSGQKLETVLGGVPSLAHLVSAIRSKRPTQSVAVSGQLLCNGEPATNVELKLYDHDTFTPNDLMATNSTDEEGRFYIAGHEYEFTQITPHLDVLHSCGRKKDCMRKLTISVPKNHVAKGQTPKQAFDVGSVELSGRFSGEASNCFQ